MISQSDTRTVLVTLDGCAHNWCTCRRPDWDRQNYGTSSSILERCDDVPGSNDSGTRRPVVRRVRFPLSRRHCLDPDTPSQAYGLGLLYYHPSIGQGTSIGFGSARAPLRRKLGLIGIRSSLLLPGLISPPLTLSKCGWLYPDKGASKVPRVLEFRANLIDHFARRCIR